MKNNINNTPDFQNLKVLSKNALAARSYFVPAENREEYLKNGNMREAAESSRYLLLSGDWKFLYFNSLSKVPENAAECGGEEWDTIQVPSCWQSLGYEIPFYVNNDFTCPAVPPLVPNDNPVGVYKKRFSLPERFIGKRITLTFLGVCSAYHVYINGVQIGYAQGSHNMHEFDITSYLKDGENDLTVIVYKWSDGSFLESQDMFRYNGIFRDVYLTAAEEKSVFDFTFKTKHLEKNNFSCSLSAKLLGGASELTVSLLDGEQKEIYRSTTQNGELTFPVHDVLLWNAETPNCYTLLLELNGGNGICECVGHTVGFKYIDYSTKVFRLNGMPIKLRGVNHHDTNAEHGYVVTLEEMREDVRLMKELNVNSVRTSHYPPEPRLLELCSKAGLYVVDEADLESYGSISMYHEYDYFGTHKEFEAAFIDRQEHLYQRDKNDVSVIMLSLGNEAGIGENFDVAYRYLKQYSDLPVQYETCFRDYQYGNVDKNGYDIVSYMYPDMAKIEEWMEKDDDRPFYMCEYEHAMGVGPGSFKEYMEKIYRYEKFMGGCVWEWQDHAVRHKDGVEYTYGGDHGEYVHDSNFCCDGLIYPDKTPSRSAYEMKNAYRPILAELVSVKENLATVSLFNAFSFTPLSDLDIEYRILITGKEICGGKVHSDLLPLQTETVQIDLPDFAEKGEYVINFEYTYHGNCVGFDSIVLADTTKNESVHAPIAFNCMETDNEILFEDGVRSLVFDKNKCTFVSIRKGDTEFLNQKPCNRGYNAYADATRGFYANIWYAPIDNMVHYKQNWYNNLFNLMFISFYSLDVQKSETDVQITVKGLFSPPKYSKKFEIEHVYTVHSDLSLTVTSKLICCQDELPFLPKFGVQFEMAQEFDDVRWYGYGPGESYPDFLLGVRKGEYASDVNSLTEPYIRPQGASERCGVKWLEIADRNGNCLRVDCEDSDFAFACQHFTTEMYEKCRHREDVREMPTTVVSVDGFVSGVGSQSCGWLPLPRYLVQPKQDDVFEFKFHLKTV